MCKRLKEVLVGVKMTAKQKLVYNAIAEDMGAIFHIVEQQKEDSQKAREKIDEKVDNLTKQVSNIETRQNILMQNIQDIHNKIVNKSLHEKAYLVDRYTELSKNWKFWIIILVCSTIIGLGMTVIFEKADSVTKIISAIK